MVTAVRSVRVGLALLVGVVALLVAGVSPASAATSDPYAPQTLGAPVGRHNVVALGSVQWNFAAGQTAYVRAVLRANDASYRILVDNEVRCFGPGGWTKSMVIGQNVYAAGSSPEDDIQLTTRFLVHPGAAGSVTCIGYSRTATLGNTAETVRLASGFIEFADLTVANTVAGTPIQASVASGIKVTSGNPAREPSTGMFEVAPGTAGLSVFGDTEFQVDCVSQADDPCGVADSTTAKFSLYVNQWKSDGTLCYSTPVASVTKTMSYSVHHVYVPLNIPNVTVRTGNGCAPRFNAYVKVDWLGGWPGTVQGVSRALSDTSDPSGPTHSADMSHIFAVPF